MRRVTEAARLQHRGLGELLKGLLLLVLLLKAAASYGLETPDYEVLYTEGNIEYRRYAAFNVAQTSVGNADSLENRGKMNQDGFMRLFRYITGDNLTQSSIAMTAPVIETSGAKIAMTAPVIESEADGELRMAFMLPSEYTLDTAPTPTDSAVTLREIPARLVASIRYSGRWTEKNVQKFKTRLDAHLSEAGIKTLGEFSTAVYNPPFTPPFMRRNEIHYEIDALPLSLQLGPNS
jgi:hypothetical protein